MVEVVDVGSCNVSCYQFIKCILEYRRFRQGTMIPISGIHFKCLHSNCTKTVMKKYFFTFLTLHFLQV